MSSSGQVLQDMTSLLRHALEKRHGLDPRLCSQCGKIAELLGYTVNTNFPPVSSKAAEAPGGQDDGLCMQSTGQHLIAGASMFACYLPKGHTGDHERGGRCFKHGLYVGQQCPKWPDCITGIVAAPAAPSERADNLEQAVSICEENGARWMQVEVAEVRSLLKRAGLSSQEGK